jgi:thioesterase domain-containing protein
MLFRSTEIELETAKAFAEAGIDIGDPARGWDRLCSRLAIRWIPGYHVTMVTEPGVRVLADALTRSLNEALIAL